MKSSLQENTERLFKASEEKIKELLIKVQASQANVLRQVNDKMSASEASVKNEILQLDDKTKAFEDISRIWQG